MKGSGEDGGNEDEEGMGRRALARGSSRRAEELEGGADATKTDRRPQQSEDV